MGWIGVDLDGVLAQYTGWQGSDHIGEPVPTMVTRIRELLAHGQEIRIFTARAHDPAAIPLIDAWSIRHIGRSLQITACKDAQCIEIWDDRCREVQPNTGVFVRESLVDELDTATRIIRELRAKDAVT